MPEFLIFPPHIRQAQAALVGAGFPIEKDGPAFAALMFATIAWERTPHVSLAHQMQERLTAAERENRRLTAELLREGARADHLKGRLRRYEVVSTEVDYTTGPVPTYEEFYAAHMASGGGCIPTREMWASVNETCQRQLLAIAQQPGRIKPENRVLPQCSDNQHSPIKPEICGFMGEPVNQSLR